MAISELPALSPFCYTLAGEKMRVLWMIFIAIGLIACDSGGNGNSDLGGSNSGSSGSGNSFDAQVNLAGAWTYSISFSANSVCAGKNPRGTLTIAPQAGDSTKIGIAIAEGQGVYVDEYDNCYITYNNYNEDSSSSGRPIIQTASQYLSYAEKDALDDQNIRLDSFGARRILEVHTHDTGVVIYFLLTR